MTHSYEVSKPGSNSRQNCKKDDIGRITICYYLTKKTICMQLLQTEFSQGLSYKFHINISDMIPDVGLPIRYVDFLLLYLVKLEVFLVN